MLRRLRRWHWTLLHTVFGLPDRNHVEPHAPLSAILRSHPEVPAHRHRLVPRHSPSLSEQRERELQRQPRVLKRWQLRIGTLFGQHRAD